MPFIHKRIVSIAAILLFFTITSLHASPRKIELKGLKVYSSNELYSILNLSEFEDRKIPVSNVINRIGGFYTSRGYELLRISILKNSPDSLILYIDEGELGKIVIHNLNSYYSLKIRQQINTRNKIYNRLEIEKNIEIIKNTYNITHVKTELRPVKEFDENIFQLRRDLKSLELGFAEIELFADHAPAYDLHIYVEKIKNGKLLADKSGIGFEIDYKFPSLFIPEVSWYKNDFLGNGDMFKVSASSGFDFALKRFFKIPPGEYPSFPPERSFIELKGEYKFMPINSDIFTPIVKGKIYHTDSSRPDLGLERYQYILTRGFFAPGFTFLSSFNIYGGAGIENVYFFDSKIDMESSDHIYIEDRIERYPFTEFQIKLEPIPVRIGNRIDKNMTFTYRELFSRYSASEIELNIEYDFEFKNLSVLSIESMTKLFFRDPPFHHQDEVNSGTFKGFSGKGYYSEKLSAFSTEYRFSVHEDFIYTGFFCDLVFFEAEGFEISGFKKGIIAGPTARILFLDQFEFIVYFGRDILLPDGTSQNNINMRFRKKW